ncbi:MAG: hypothetical protein IPJ85_10500 [Flavobacteriales bacterium]|nr:hypothetical protein [Flavobacteriales bacterium]
MYTYWAGIDVGVNTLIDKSGNPDLSGNAGIHGNRQRPFALREHQLHGAEESSSAPTM